MQRYFAITRLAMQRQFTYRAALLAGLLTNFFFGLLRATVMIALYDQRGQVAGISLQDAVTYTGLTQAVIAFLMLFSWFEVIDSVHTGQVGADLLKPVSFYGFWMAQDFGQAVVNLALRGATILAFFALVYRISLPHSAGQWLALGVSLLLSWLVSFAWRFLLNLSAFWVTNARGLARLFFGLSWMLSGFFMPLKFYPDWFARLAYLTPFPHMVNSLVEVYLGLVQGPELVNTLLQQAAWGVGLVILGQVALRAGVRRLVVQGG